MRDAGKRWVKIIPVILPAPSSEAASSATEYIYFNAVLALLPSNLFAQAHLNNRIENKLLTLFSYLFYLYSIIYKLHIIKI